ncbi:Yip1 domain family, member 5, putative [Acanthamoeba castellanii str. Neff]|uniref:Protein YIPF n=1 Tax=Acanthamoeba castellanii (strain ATCC 30010 / Neff) TaxID=1257118 RepID=L8HDR6_ACACF|nr:Yip1 domain family, member 5, putative [Acanthamoeba castellanii str. Neff]ELR22531.1 Yip1 domain family, member 5, putative [Acanthamoeba castellanii str. Neff]
MEGQGYGYPQQDQSLQFFPTSYSDDDGMSGGGGFDFNAAGAEGSGQFMSQPLGLSSSGHMEGNTSGFEDEPPLLEELGINLTHIRVKTLAVLNPMSRLDAEIIGDRDLAGPIMFCLLLGAILLLSGKVHFGYIYGIGVLGCLGVYVMMNLLSERGIDIYKTASILGYCLLPVIGLAGLSIFIRMNSIVGYVLAVVCIGWCTHSAALMFVTLLTMKDQHILVAYPIGLLYACFALISVF